MSIQYEVIRIQERADLEAAFHIRKLVFVEEQHVDPELEYDEFEDSSAQYLLRQADGTPIATARWRRTDKGVKMERFAVLKGHRCHGAGAALVRALLADIKILHQGFPVYLHAQVQVIPFYEKLGFHAEGPEFIEADIRHRKMVKGENQ